MRAVLAFALLAGCIAAEPGKETENASARKACTDLEGRAFHGAGAQVVSFVADDAEYSTYTETTADGAQSMGIAQCLTVNGTTSVIYLDGAIDHYSARVDVRNADTAPELFVRWTDGRLLTSQN